MFMDYFNLISSDKITSFYKIFLLDAYADFCKYNYKGSSSFAVFKTTKQTFESKRLRYRGTFQKLFIVSKILTDEFADKAILKRNPR